MSYLNPIVRVTVCIFVFLFLPQLSHSQISADPPRFEIHAHDQNIASEVETILESSYQRISDFLDDSLTDVVSVYVVESEEEFVAMVGSKFPDWGVACAIPGRNLIILKSPLQFKYGGRARAGPHIHRKALRGGKGPPMVG
jgi:hypothetical protein